MATLKEERFLGLPKSNYSKVLSDDYVHGGNNIETLKLKSVSSSGAVTNYKTSFSVAKGETSNEIKQSDEIKFTVPYKSFKM